jgi:photosystem II stability/assembly factor-like uncharacterized protein
VANPWIWAGINEWTVVGWLEGGFVGAVVIDPQNPGTLYATSSAGIFKSKDAGANWHPLTFGLTITALTALVINPQASSTLYVGTAGRGVFKSIDGAESWAPTALTNTFVSQLAIDPQNPRILYAATTGTLFESAAIYKTTDGGVSWTALARGGFGKSVLSIDPQDSSTIYAGEGGCCSDGGLHKSIDGGMSWTLVPALNGCLMTAVLFPQQTPHTVYASASCFAIRGNDEILVGKVFRSTDSGSSWNTVNSGLPETLSVTALAIDPQNPAILYAATSDKGIFKSADNGTSWNSADPRLPWANALAIDPQNPNRIYAGTGDGLLKSINGGTSWSFVNAGLNAVGISALAVDPLEPSTSYASALLPSAPGRVFKTTDKGTTWTLVNPAGNNVTIGLAVDPRDRSVYAITNGALFKSGDGGASWAVKSGRPQERQFVSLALDPQTPNTIYAGTAGGGVFKSTDAGTTWRAVNSGMESMTPFVSAYALAVDPTTSGTLYASTSSGLFKSTDAATTWNRVNSVSAETPIRALVIAAQTPSAIYAVTSNGLLRSTDGGASWSVVNFGMEASSVRALAIDPQNPRTLYAGTSRGLFAITFEAQLPPLIRSIEFSKTSVPVGDSYIATASGTNLTAQTYFDIRYRAPGSTVDEEALNWQTGPAAVHGIPAGMGLGTWIVTGIRAHEDPADHTNSYFPASASITVLAN